MAPLTRLVDAALTLIAIERGALTQRVRGRQELGRRRGMVNLVRAGGSFQLPPEILYVLFPAVGFG